MTEPRPRSALRVFSLAVLPAVLLHGMVLGGSTGSDIQTSAAPTLAPLRVRAVLPAAQPAEPAAATTPATLPQPTASVAPAAVDRPGPDLPSLDEQTSDRAAATDIEVSPEPEPATPQEAVQPAIDDQAVLLAQAADRATTVAQPGGLTEVDGLAIPVYPTAFAPSQVLRYHLQRGLLSGSGELSWRADPPTQAGAQYELQLKASIARLTILTQVSTGGFDKAGLAPVRFTDQRLRGSVRAANFQRQRGLISFSGPSVEYPLVRGVQDRLSWMIQLPAILAANPRLARPGQEITLYVVGARGDASTWVFRCVAKEQVTTELGLVDTVKFIRDPRQQHDTLAEVWLDPARHFLAVRASVGNPDDGAMLELLRKQD